jgi:5-deoxy-D-glucuronate isomerase
MQRTKRQNADTSREEIRGVPDLLATSDGQPDRDGTLIKVTPESAGWKYVGFEVLRLEAGRSASRQKP